MNKLLILNENKAYIKVLMFMLQREGYQTKGTTNNFEFTQRLSDFNPDLIILDLGGKNNFGTKMAIKLKQQQETRHLPIIMCYDKDHLAIEKATDHVADRYVAKPLDMDLLLKAIQELTSK